MFLAWAREQVKVHLASVESWAQIRLDTQMQPFSLDILQGRKGDLAGGDTG